MTVHDPLPVPYDRVPEARGPVGRSKADRPRDGAATDSGGVMVGLPFLEHPRDDRLQRGILDAQVGDRVAVEDRASLVAWLATTTP